MALDLEAFDASPVGFLPHDQLAARLDPGFESLSCLSILHVLSSKGKYTNPGAEASFSDAIVRVVWILSNVTDQRKK